MEETTRKPTWWNVTMAWGQEDEGTYSESFLTPDEEAAKRLCAEEMASAREADFESPDDRARFIESRMQGYADVYKTADQFRQNFLRLFGDAIFGEGPRRDIDLDKLAEVLTANRDEFLERPADAQRPRG